MRSLPRRTSARSRLAVAGSAIVLVIAVIFSALHSSGPPPLPLPGLGRPALPGDPFGYQSSRQADFEARARAGEEQVLFLKSPGGALATAARVAAYRPLVDAATKGTGIDPNLLEAIVFLESAGYPDALAGADAADAAGLTQILAQTGQSLLGMHIDLARSRRLTQAIATAYALGEAGRFATLQRERARIDGRFDPPKALAATVRYLEIARRDLGRADLAVVSYHMGIGNLENVLHDYDGGRPVPYAQLFFDTTLDRHAAAFALLQGFGDDSSLYYWRVLAAENIMSLYRSNRSQLAQLSALETAGDDDEDVLHPSSETGVFATPSDLAYAYASRAVLPLPSDPGKLGLAYSPAIGSLAHRLGQSPALYRGLRPAALDLLIELAARVRVLSGSKTPLIVAQAVTDRSYEHLLGASGGYSLATTGYEFEIERSYASGAQAGAFQAMLDRLQALNLIAWARESTTIDITVASDAGRAIVNGP
ncbi:MAG TPA: transglycosylase SLT domain-containing protein [Solirubrobacteraceae bacterium]